jgi:hypothetical protein
LNDNQNSIANVLFCALRLKASYVLFILILAVGAEILAVEAEFKISGGVEKITLLDTKA